MHTTHPAKQPGATFCGTCQLPRLELGVPHGHRGPFCLCPPAPIPSAKIETKWIGPAPNEKS